MIKIKPIVKLDSVLENIKNLDERNKLFHALSNADQRREIARDAIKLLILETIVPRRGIYWNENLTNLLSTNATDTQCNLIEKIGGKNCEVCAKGIWMLSRIRMGNEIALNDSDCKHDIAEGNTICNRLIDDDEFDTMEDIFEVWGSSDYLVDIDSLFDYESKKNIRELLILLMCNIIVNGYFNKFDETDYLIH